LIQAYEHHKSVPNKNIHCYNFSLYPEDFQPSGTCYFSDIKEKHLRLDVTSNPLDLPDPDFVSNSYALAATNSGQANSGLQLKVFALNYNLMKIKSGNIV
ncbi:uncharacterized protein METZ01_LOCUS513189, partial [marine metagenome]